MCSLQSSQDKQQVGTSQFDDQVQKLGPWDSTGRPLTLLLQLSRLSACNKGIQAQLQQLSGPELDPSAVNSTRTGLHRKVQIAWKIKQAVYWHGQEQRMCHSGNRSVFATSLAYMVQHIPAVSCEVRISCAACASFATSARFVALAHKSKLCRYVASSPISDLHACSDHGS